jgi:hypothetical protein
VVSLLVLEEMGWRNGFGSETLNNLPCEVYLLYPQRQAEQWTTVSSSLSSRSVYPSPVGGKQGE